MLNRWRTTRQCSPSQVDVRAWATQLAKLRTTRQWFDHFASVQRDGDRFMTSHDLLRAIALYPSEDGLREV